MPLTVGGGVRTVEDIRKLLHAGADKVSINTAAVHRRQFVAEGADKFGAGASSSPSTPSGCRSRAPRRAGSCSRTAGKPTGLEAIAYAREVVALGAGEILLTSMDRDGTKAGFDLELTRAIADAVTVPVIASGGVGTLEHLVEGVTQGHASAVLPPPSSTTAPSASAKPSATWPPPPHAARWARCVSTFSEPGQRSDCGAQVQLRCSRSPTDETAILTHCRSRRQ